MEKFFVFLAFSLLLMLTFTSCGNSCLGNSSIGNSDIGNSDINDDNNTEIGGNVGGGENTEDAENVYNGENTDHTHSFSEWVTTKVATCAEQGEMERSCECGEKETESIAAPIHTMIDGICSVCGKTYSQGLEFVSNDDGTCYVKGIGSCTDSDLVIPPTSPDGDSVTSIKNFAFTECKNLVSVIIPYSVKSIGTVAFLRCYALTSIIVEADNSNYKSIDGNLYTKDGTKLVQYATGKKDTVFTISDNVMSIGEKAFFWCQTLTSIIIPDSVMSIGEEAFFQCSGLTSIIIPCSVIHIGDRAFWACYSLSSITVEEDNANYKSIDGNLYSRSGEIFIQYAINKKDTEFNIPNGVTSIGVYAFYGCGSLSSVVIPDSVISIEIVAFRECCNLTSIVIGNSVKSVGDQAFYDCYSLTDVYYTGSEEDWGKINFSNSILNATIHYNYEE